MTLLRRSCGAGECRQALGPVPSPGNGEQRFKGVEDFGTDRFLKDLFVVTVQIANLKPGMEVGSPSAEGIPLPGS